MRKGLRKTLSLVLTIALLLPTLPQFMFSNANAAQSTNIHESQTQPNILLSDNMDSTQSGWSITGSNDSVYIHDQTSLGIPAQKGQFLFGSSEEGTSTATAYRPTVSFDDSWALEMNMDIKSLQTPKKKNALAGFSIQVIDNTRHEYAIAIHSLDKKNSATVCFNSTKGIRTEEIIVPEGMHTWNFFFDNEQKGMTVFIDGKSVATFEHIEAPVNLKSNRFALMNIMEEASSGTNMVTVDSIKLYKQHDILFTLFSPTASSQKFCMDVQLFTENSADYTSGKLTLQLIFEDMHSHKKELSFPVTAQNMQLTAENINIHGNASVTTQLSYSGHIVAKKSKPFYFYPQVSRANGGETITASRGVTLFDHFESLTPKAMDAGWAVSSYRYKNTAEEKILLETNGEANALEIPLTCNGNFGVYVGYVNGSNGFKAKLNGEEQDVLLSNSFIPSENLYSNNIISEAFVLATNCKNSKLTIYPQRGKNLRLAYIKFVPFTNEEMALYQTPNSKQNTFMMDNDGFTDFYNGLFSDEISLRYNTMEKLATQAGIGELVWCAGTTGMMNYSSPTVWNLFKEESFENSPENLFDIRDKEGNRKPYDFQLRKGDRRAREDILGFQYTDPNHNNPATWPITLLADEGKKFDVSVSASLRMRTFYYEKDYIILNGQVFYRPMTLSYEDKNFLNYIKSLVVEMGSAPNVDSVFLDFGRYPSVFLPERDEAGNPVSIKLTKEQKSKIVLDMLRELRAKLPNKKIYARILIDHNNKEIGLDYERWVREKLIDRLITTVQAYETFYDFKPYLDLCHKNGVEYYLGISANQSGADLTIEDEKLMEQGLFHPNNKYLSIQQYLDRAYEGYTHGVDGVYLFNTLNDLQFIKNINPKFRYLGNEVQLKKWKALETRAESVDDPISITKQGESALQDHYAGLGALSTTVSPIVPVFNPEIHAYSLSVPYYFDYLNLSASPFIKEASMQISVNGTNIHGTNQTYQIPLNIGENMIQIAVTSANGKNNRTYKIKAIRKKAANQKDRISEVAYGSHYPVVHGNANRIFAPDKNLSYAEATQMLANILKTKNIKPTSNPIWNGKWYTQAMGTLQAMGLLQDIAITQPDAAISRAEFAAMIARVIRLEKVSGKGHFTDISGHRFEKEMIALNEAKIIMGFADNDFRPDAKLTRAEACAILCRILSRNASDSTESPFYVDVPKTHWAAPYIYSASGR